jgi:hypothetical protein
MSRAAPTDFAGDFVYRIYTALEPDSVDIEKLVGLAFRLSAVNLAFAADVVSDSGFWCRLDRLFAPPTAG